MIVLGNLLILFSWTNYYSLVKFEYFGFYLIKLVFFKILIQHEYYFTYMSLCSLKRNNYF